MQNGHPKKQLLLRSETWLAFLEIRFPSIYCSKSSQENATWFHTQLINTRWTIKKYHHDMPLACFNCSNTFIKHPKVVRFFYGSPSMNQLTERNSVACFCHNLTVFEQTESSSKHKGRTAETVLLDVLKKLIYDHSRPTATFSDLTKWSFEQNNTKHKSAPMHSFPFSQNVQQIILRAGRWKNGVQFSKITANNSRTLILLNSATQNQNIWEIKNRESPKFFTLN